MPLMEIVFWIAVGFVFYAYLGYPMALFVLSMFRKRPVDKGNITPKVSFIISAYNEEKRIGAKIENTLRQNYPTDKREIIVSSDCSTDRTEDIVRSYRWAEVKLVRAPERKGKEAAQRLAIQSAEGEILVFSDVATILPLNGLSTIVKNFHDRTVGCVSSVDRFIDGDGTVSGEGAYVRYEMLLRMLETKVNTVVGLSGSFFAARRQVCQDWATELQSDFNTLLNTVKLGLRGVSDPESIGYYENIADESKEFERKVRTVLRGISVFMRSLPLLNPLRYGLFSWQFLSHKLCRWLVPFAMILVFASNALLFSVSALYRYVFVFQLVFYAITLASIAFNWFPRKNLLRIPSFVLVVNLSILSAWYRYLRGERIVAWNPSKR